MLAGGLRECQPGEAPGPDDRVVADASTCPPPEPTAGLSRLVALRSAGDRARATDFVAAQGWSGFGCGALLESAPPGSADLEVAGCLTDGDVLGGVAVRAGVWGAVVAPLPEVWPALAGWVAAARPGLARLSGTAPVLDALAAARPALFARAGEFRLSMTVLGTLQPPVRPLPPVRRARLRDAPALHRIYDGVPWMRLPDLAAMRAHLRAERTFVAEIGGRPVAVARWTHRFRHLLEVGAVACDPHHRRQGAATAVVVAACQAARRARRGVLLRYGDPQAGLLYHRLGFEHAGQMVIREWPAA